MSIRLLLTLLLLPGAGAWSTTCAADPYVVGVWADPDRTRSCVEGATGFGFHQRVFAWTPADQGVVYVTLRFDFPDNLDRTAKPVFHETVSEVVFTDYSDGTVEWNMIFDTSCPTEWVEIFSQECELLDDQPSRIEIEARHSMIRDCDFALQNVVVAGELAINPRDCGTVAMRPLSWGAVKGRFR